MHLRVVQLGWGVTLRGAGFFIRSFATMIITFYTTTALRQQKLAGQQPCSRSTMRTHSAHTRARTRTHTGITQSQRHEATYEATYRHEAMYSV